MSRKIKLIWDFKGDDAQQTAEHHKIHLTEFAERENLSLTTAAVETLNENHTIAYIIVVEPEMIKVRDALLPNRGELAK
jgi:hypothetical protein